MISRRAYCASFLVVAACALLFAAPGTRAETSYVGQSDLVDWSCAGSPCPWGTWLNGHALVWPAALDPASERFGYTTSGGVYLSAEYANRITIWIDSGSATLYAGYPDEVSHRALATLSDSYHYDVSGLAPGEVLSVQSGSAFDYQIDVRPTPTPEVPPVGVPSEFVTWDCTGSNCPWGSSLGGHALVWPESAEASTARFGYTVSKPVYLPATRANGTAVRLESGMASLYAGAPDASNHRLIATLGPGEVYEVSGLFAGEGLSVQSDGEFVYEVDVADPSVPEDPPGAPEPPPPGGDPSPSATSQWVTWNCTSSPCPWGSELSGQAEVWATPAATDSRLGYTTSSPIYLPAEVANGTRVLLTDGEAALYAGLPGTLSHQLVATLSHGVEYEVLGLLAGEVLSLQGPSAFSVAVELGNGGIEEPPPPPEGLVYSIPAYWRCDIPECTGDDWLGSVIDWPSWAAYPNNIRAGDQSRTVYSETGAVLYPYMGPWAHGCEVTAYSGTVLIIEWERGTDEWREIWLQPGETHVIQLIEPHDGALIEINGHFNDFAILLNNCTPQPVP